MRFIVKFIIHILRTFTPDGICAVRQDASIPSVQFGIDLADKEEQSKFQYVKGDTEGFVNIPLSIKNIIFSVFLREDTEKNMIKVSLRSVGTFLVIKWLPNF